MKKTSFIWPIIIIILFIVPIIINIFGDILWFQSIGYTNVFMTMLLTSIGIGLLFGLVFLAFGILNIKIAKRMHKSKADSKLLILLAGFFSLIIGSVFSGWEVVLKYLNPSVFGVVDPVFGLDIGFYVFTLPFYSLIYSYLFVFTVLGIVLSFISHIIFSESLKKSEKTEEDEVDFIFAAKSDYTLDWKEFKKKITPHLSILLAILFFVLSFGFWMAQYGLLFSQGGAVYGAGYTDINISLPLLNILMIVSAAVALFFLANLKINKWKIVKEGIIIFAIIVILGGVVSGVVQGFVVAPDESNIEKPYIERNIEYTLKAYGLDIVKENIFPVNYNLTKDDIKRNSGTIENIRLWDWRPLTQTYNQLQLFRTYYKFPDIDIDRYNVNGEYKQVMVSPREINLENLPREARSWVNEHLVYTHGYGVVMNPVDKVTNGLPDFYIKDIPPQSEQFSIERPEIYYGEETYEYSVVNTKTDELDYPSGEQNIYAKHEGTGGVQLSDIITRLLYAVKFGSIELLFSGSLTSESRILFYKQVNERIATIAPFLRYDSDPYIVLSEGNLYWIIDAYTITSQYPYSEPTGRRDGFNYIRNSVKVVVNAYSGDVEFYVIDNKDPIINTYQSIFPNMFKDFSEMSADLKEHIRYPEGLFKIQANIYSTYHMRDPKVFYNKEDIWVTPTEIYRGSRQEMIPYYIIMKLPGEDKESFIMMLPFNPRGKENLIGWMAAKSDMPDYGKLVVYQFSKQELTYGPMQIEARIDQDTDISQKITLWSQRGSDVIRGNTLVIPIEDSIIYVEPLFLEAVERGTLPELKRVIVAYGNQLTMQETLEEALNTIFEQATTSVERSEQTAEEKLAEIARLYKKAKEALSNGDLAGYANYVDMIEDFV
ncbi:MAG: UPF0182 family protein [Candidatus Aenigmarchaeota archaeon]|nr:UPF0182 family protein [Candidatus Aenigmarchaeota archaeon]